MSTPRSAILGRQTARRGMLPLSVPVVAAWAATLVVALYLLFMVGQSTWTLAIDAVLIGGVLCATLDFGLHESYAARLVKTIRNRRRRRRGEHVWVSPSDLHDLGSEHGGATSIMVRRPR